MSGVVQLGRLEKQGHIGSGLNRIDLPFLDQPDFLPVQLHLFCKMGLASVRLEIPIELMLCLVSGEVDLVVFCNLE